MQHATAKYLNAFFSSNLQLTMITFNNLIMVAMVFVYTFLLIIIFLFLIDEDKSRKNEAMSLELHSTTLNIIFLYLLPFHERTSL